jgi:hypothetical protein
MVLTGTISGHFLICSKNHREKKDCCSLAVWNHWISLKFGSNMHSVNVSYIWKFEIKVLLISWLGAVLIVLGVHRFLRISETFDRLSIEDSHLLSFFKSTRLLQRLFPSQIGVKEGLCIVNNLWRFHDRKHTASWDRGLWRFMSRSFRGTSLALRHLAPETRTWRTSNPIKSL